MSTAHSTYPAFATPTPSGNTVWFKQRFAESSITTKPVTLKSGAVVPIPLLLRGHRRDLDEKGSRQGPGPGHR